MPPESKFSVAVVDDEESVREALTVALEQRFKVDAYADAEALLKAMKSRTYAAVLVDIYLPGKSGTVLLDSLKATWPLTEVVMITADRQHGIELAQECYAKGAYDFVLKPFEIGALVRTVMRAAEKYALTRSLEAATGQLRHLKAGTLVSRPTRAPKKSSPAVLIDGLSNLFLRPAKKASPPRSGEGLWQIVGQLEKRSIEKALASTQWNQVWAAKLLGIHRATLVEKMKHHRITTVKRPQGLGS